MTEASTHHSGSVHSGTSLPACSELAGLGARPTIRGLCLVIVLGLITACAGGAIQVSGEPPLTRLDGLTIDGDELVLAFAVRNVNDKSLDVPSMQYRLQLDGARVADFDEGRPQLSIPPRGRELVHIRARAPSGILEELDRLARGERANLPWRLEVTVDGLARRNQPEPATGFLHRVPGQSDRFR